LEAVAITGVGIVSPLGWGCHDNRSGLQAGRSGIGPISRFDAAPFRSQVAAEVPESTAPAARLADSRRSRTDAFALAAADEALVQAGWTRDGGPALQRVGVYVGSSTGGMSESESWYRAALCSRCGAASTRRLRAHLQHHTAEAIARCHGFAGGIETNSTACSAASLAIEAAFDDLRQGCVTAAIAGGSDALCQLTFGGFNALQLVDVEPCRPYQLDRRGISLGEGAAMLVLEPLRAARQRSARVHARLIGAGSSCDAHHMTAPHPHGEGATRAIRAALHDAGLPPGDVDLLLVHGTATRQNDASEWAAIAEVFGKRAGDLPAVATKANVGHQLGASGSFQAALAVFCLSGDPIPPAVHAGNPDSAAPLRLEHALQDLEPEVVLSLSFAFGGANAALVFARAGGC